jgi:hypothetical protein
MGIAILVQYHITTKILQLLTNSQQINKKTKNWGWTRQNSFGANLWAHHRDFLLGKYD